MNTYTLVIKLSTDTKVTENQLDQIAKNIGIDLTSFNDTEGLIVNENENIHFNSVSVEVV